VLSWAARWKGSAAPPAEGCKGDAKAEPAEAEKPSESPVPELPVSFEVRWAGWGEKEKGGLEKKKRVGACHVLGKWVTDPLEKDRVFVRAIEGFEPPPELTTVSTFDAPGHRLFTPAAAAAAAIAAAAVRPCVGACDGS